MGKDKKNSLIRKNFTLCILQLGSKNSTMNKYPLLMGGSEMSVILENEYGVVNINKDVVSAIAGASAIECYGLVGMVSKSASDGIASLLKRDSLNKGINIEVEEDGIVIDLYVIIQFGTKISVVAQNIIDKIKYNVENQTGLKVLKVNLNIEGVRVQE